LLESPKTREEENVAKEQRDQHEKDDPQEPRRRSEYVVARVRRLGNDRVGIRVRSHLQASVSHSGANPSHNRPCQKITVEIFETTFLTMKITKNYMEWSSGVLSTTNGRENDRKSSLKTMPKIKKKA
jgi:hypothetical protein